MDLGPRIPLKGLTWVHFSGLGFRLPFIGPISGYVGSWVHLKDPGLGFGGLGFRVHLKGATLNPKPSAIL